MRSRILHRARRACRWLREFDDLLQKNPKPNLTEYLGEYGKVADWN